MTVADEIQKISDTKADLKTAIEAKGVSVGAIPFDEYAGRVSLIDGGIVATVPAAMVPTTHFTATDNADDSGLTISIIAAPAAGTSPITGYQYTIGGGVWSDLSGGTATGGRVIAVDAGTLVLVGVRAVSLAGAGFSPTATIDFIVTDGSATISATATTAAEVTSLTTEAFTGTGAFAAAGAGVTRIVNIDAGAVGAFDVGQTAADALAGRVEIRGRSDGSTVFTGDTQFWRGAAGNASGVGCDVLFDDLTLTIGDVGTDIPSSRVANEMLKQEGVCGSYTWGPGVKWLGATNYDYDDRSVLWGYVDTGGIAGAFTPGEVATWTNGGTVYGSIVLGVSGSWVYLSDHDKDDYNGTIYTTAVRDHLDAGDVLTGATSGATATSSDTGLQTAVGQCPNLSQIGATFYCTESNFHGEAAFGSECVRTAADARVNISGARIHHNTSDAIKIKGLGSANVIGNQSQFPLVIRVAGVWSYHALGGKDLYGAPHADFLQVYENTTDNRASLYQIENCTLFAGLGAVNDGIGAKPQGIIMGGGGTFTGALAGSYFRNNVFEQNGQPNPLLYSNCDQMDISGNCFLSIACDPDERGISPKSRLTNCTNCTLSNNLWSGVLITGGSGNVVSGNRDIGSPNGTAYPATFPAFAANAFARVESIEAMLSLFTPAQGVTEGCINPNGQWIGSASEVIWTANGAPGGAVVQSIIVDELPAPLTVPYVYDSGHGDTLCDVYRSGSATPNGTIHVRGYNVAGSTDWQSVTVDAAGDWSVNLQIPVERWGLWYEFEAASVAAETGGIRAKAVRLFGCGHVVGIMEQSEGARVMHANSEPGTWAIPTIQAAAGNENCVLFVDEADDGTILEYVISEAEVASGANVSRGLGLMANFLHHNAPGRKFALIDYVVPGTSRGQLETDANSGVSNNRSFLDFEAMTARARGAGSDVGLIVECWYNSDAANLDEFSETFGEFYTGIDISDGSTATTTDGNYLWDLSGGGRGVFDAEKTKWAAIRPMPFCFYSDTEPTLLRNSTTKADGSLWARGRNIEDGRAGVDAFAGNSYVAGFRAGAGQFTSAHYTAFLGSHQLTTTKNGAGLYAQVHALAICQALGIVTATDPTFTGVTVDGSGAYADILVSIPTGSRLSTVAAEEILPDPDISIRPVHWQPVMGVEIQRSGDGADEQRPVYRTGQGVASHRGVVEIVDNGAGTGTARIRVTPETAFATGDRIQLSRGGGSTVIDQETTEPEMYGGGHLPIAVLDSLKDPDATGTHYDFPGLPVIPPSDVTGFELTLGAGLSAPVNTAPPTITGSATIGELMTIAAGTWTGNPAPTLTYQWQMNGADIGGATGLTYTTVAAGALTAEVTATNSEGVVSVTTAARTIGAASTNYSIPAATSLRAPANLGTGVFEISAEIRFSKDELPDGTETHILLSQSASFMTIGLLNGSPAPVRVMAVKNDAGAHVVTGASGGEVTAGAWHTLKLSMSVDSGGTPHVRAWLQRDGGSNSLVYDAGAVVSGTQFEPSRYMVFFGDTTPTVNDAFGPAEIEYCRLWLGQSDSGGDFSGFGTPEFDLETDFADQATDPGDGRWYRIDG